MRKSIQGLSLFILLLISCKSFHNPFNIPVGESNYSENTPLGVVYTLRQAYISRDLTLYLSCLHRDSFRFYFNAQDTVVRRILETDLGIDSMVWGFEEEKLATEALFELSSSIYLEYLNPVSFFSSDSSVFYFMSSYYMVVGERGGNSEIAEGKLVFTLKKDSGKWYIFRWDDYPL